MYDGYHFCMNCPDIYNPFSLLNAFAEKNKVLEREAVLLQAWFPEWRGEIRLFEITRAELPEGGELSVLLQHNDS